MGEKGKVSITPKRKGRQSMFINVFGAAEMDRRITVQKAGDSERTKQTNTT